MSDEGGRARPGASSLVSPAAQRDAATSPRAPGRSGQPQQPSQPAEPGVALELALASARRTTTRLARAIDAADYLASWSAANELRKAVAYAEHLAPPTAALPEDLTRALRDVRGAADPLLEIAPSPSPAALQEITSRRRRAGGRWDAEERAWKAARGKRADAPPPDAARTGNPTDASGAPASDAHAPTDLGDYGSPVGKHVLVLRRWDDAAIAARRVELQGRLSRTLDIKARDELLREYEAIEWVARERNLALARDPGEDAAPQAYMGGKPIKFSVPDSAQGMRAMLEREMAAGAGYDAAKEHAGARIHYATMSRSRADNDRRLIGDQQTELMDHDAAGFRAAFQAEAKQSALSMLSASAVAVDTALRSYGIAGGDVRLAEAARKVARDPGALDAEVDTWVTLSRKLDGNRAAFAAGHGRREDLAREAERLRGFQDSIAALAAEQQRLMKVLGADCRPGASGPAGRPRGGPPVESVAGTILWHPMQGSPFAQPAKPAAGSPQQQLAFVHGALQIRQAQFKAAWIEAERAHPILAAYRGRKDLDASTLAGIGSGTGTGSGSDDATTRSVIRQILPKLGNIYRTRTAIQGGALDPLQLGPVVEITKRRMFVAEGSYRDRAVHDMATRAHDKHGGLVHWAFDAVMIGLTLLTLVPTAGGSAMAALTLTGLAYDLYAGLEDYEDFKLASAASDTDLDVLRSLSNTEPSLAPLLTRLISAGVNLTVAAGLFRRAAAVRRLAMQGALDAEAVAALNRAGDELGVAGVGDETVAAATTKPPASTTPQHAPSAAPGHAPPPTAGHAPPAAPAHAPPATASPQPGHQPPVATRPTGADHQQPTMVGHQPTASAGPAATAGGARVTEPVPGLYDSIDPSFQPHGWHVAERQPVHQHPDHPERLRVVTDVTAPDGRTGWIERSYDPKAKTVVMENAFLQNVPSWMEAGRQMVPGKGSPTVTYLTLRQMKLLGAQFGELQMVKMSTIQNVEAVMQLEQMTRPPNNMALEKAVAKTHSVLYASTSIEQSGHAIARVRIDTTDAWRWQLKRMMDHFRTSPATRRELLVKYGLTENDEVLANYDILIDLVPHPTNLK